MLSEKFVFRLSSQDKLTLRQLAELEERTPADVLRRLLRHAAVRRQLGSARQADSESPEV